MPVRSEIYHVLLRFPRLFPDPAVFEDQTHLVNRYFTAIGLSREKSELLCQMTEEISAFDDQGNPSISSGTAKYPFEGRTILAEYMTNANIRISYADFGTGLIQDEHSRLWSTGKLGSLRFQLKDLQHESQALNIPDVSELYQILKDRATPSTLSTIELENTSENMLNASACYIQRALLAKAEKDGIDVEVYPARALSASEKTALEKRLTRQTSKNTLFVILRRKNDSRPSLPVE